MILVVITVTISMHFIRANQNAKSSARAVTLAQDILSALKQRADSEEPFAPQATTPIIPEVAK